MSLPQSPRKLTLLTALVFPLLFLFACGDDDDNGPAPLPPLVTLTPGVPRADVVSRGGFNDYTVQTLPGTLYKISVTNATDDVDILYFSTDATFALLAGCSIDNTDIIGTSSEDCVTPASGSQLYFSVDGTFSAASSSSYTVTVEQVDIVGMNLSLPDPAVTTKTGAVAYAVPVTSGALYTVAITGLNDDADLFVFTTNTFSAAAACILDNTQFSGSTPEDCTLSASGEVLYFIVDGIFSTTQNVLYTAFTSSAPAVAEFANEGSAGAPVALTADSVRTGQAAYGGTSYYTVSGLTAGTRYTVSINGLTNNANLTVYDNDTTFTTPAVCLINNTQFSLTTPEACTVTVTGSSLYFTVMSSTTSGGVAFLTLVEPGP